MSGLIALFIMIGIAGFIIDYSLLNTPSFCSHQSRSDLPERENHGFLGTQAEAQELELYLRCILTATTST